MENEWSSFETKALGAMCTKIGSGATPRGGSSSYLDEGEISLVRSQNVHNNIFNHDGLVFIDKDQARKLSNVVLEPNDVLLNITGESVARCCEVDPDIIPGRVNQHVAIIRPLLNEVDYKYLRYFLVSPGMQSHMLSLAGSGGTRNALTKGMIESFQIPTPPIQEQKSISHILGSLDDKIELNRRMNETLEAMAQALFQSWFVNFDPVIDKTLAVGKVIPEELKKRAERRRTLGDGQWPLPADVESLFPDEFEFTDEMGWVPKGWETLPFRNFVKYRKEKNGDQETTEYSSTNEGLFKRSDRFKKQLSKSKKTNQIIRKNDLVFGLSRQKLNFGLMKEEIGSVSPAYKVFNINTNVISAEYVETFMRTHTNFYRTIIGSSSREGQSISTDHFLSLSVLIPKSKVQEKYQLIVLPLLKRQAQSNLENEKLSAIRDNLLPKLISGELRIPDAEKLVENVL